MVSVLFAARGEGIAVCMIGPSIEQIGVAVIARDAIALEIRDMPGKGRGAKPRALVPHDAGFDDHAAAARMRANAQPGDATAAEMARAPPPARAPSRIAGPSRSEEHTSELQSLMRSS